MLRTATTQTKRMPSFLATLQDKATGMMFGKDQGTDKSAFYDLVDRDMDGNEVKMDKFKGDVLCVINVASK